MKDSENPIATRSKNMLVKALFDLMEEKPLKEISISQLTTKADLSRRTFYRLFETKEDIILYHIKDLWFQNVEQLYSLPEQSYFQTSYWSLCFWYKYRDLTILLYKNSLYVVLQKFVNEISLEVFDHTKSDIPLRKNQEALVYALSYSTGGVLNVLWKWAGEGMERTPDEIMELLMLAYERPDTKKTID